MIETDVLIVGSGPAGSAAALALSTYGIRNMVVTKYRWLADTPRAHITNQRTMEVLRDLGVEDEVNLQRSHQNLMGNNVFCTSLAGEEIGRLYSWGNSPSRMADYTLSSPTAICDVPQDLMEPILFGNACARGTRARFDTEYLALTQDATGVTATVRDRLSGHDYQIRARYLIGADGGRSKVAEDVALPMEGKMGVGGSMNIVFEADLSAYVAKRPSVLYWVLQPGANIGGIGMGVVRMVRPWNKWLIIWGYDINDPPPEMNDTVAIDVARNLIGDQTIDIKVLSHSLWTVNHMFARSNTAGRVFCMGDAVHRHPPSNGLGSNTSIQDAYNLAWKLAFVLKGKADPSLLATYDVERTPIAQQVVERANKSIGDFGPIFESLGLLSTTDSDQMKRNMEARKAATPEAATQREKLRAAIAHKTYEFNAHGVEMNQRYRSSAIAADGTPEPEWTKDPELYYQATTWPGARLPHVWLEQGGKKVSSLDLVGHGRFTLLTGIGGEAWCEAATAIGRDLGLDLVGIVVGPDRDAHDLFGDWAAMREIAEDGCVLIRPDQHVAFRAKALAADPHAILRDAILQIPGAFTLVEPLWRGHETRPHDELTGDSMTTEAQPYRQAKKYPYFEEDTSVDVVNARMGKDIDPRLRTIMAVVVKHLHAAVKEIEPTHEEWLQAITFLTDTGHMCTDWRQEFILLSDTLGVSMLVDAINHRRPNGATENTILGPFYVADAPRYAHGANICLDGKGEPLVVKGRVRDTAGRPIEGAVLDIWQTNEDGFYDVQQKGVQPDFNLRGVFASGPDGSYWFRSVKPRFYPIPDDGPVGKMLGAIGRHPNRAAHIHFIVTAPGYDPVITHIFTPDCAYLSEDAVFGVKESLIADFHHVDGPDPRPSDANAALGGHLGFHAVHGEAAI